MLGKMIDAKKREPDEEEEEEEADAVMAPPWSGPAANTESERKAKNLAYLGGATQQSSQANRDPTQEGGFGSKPVPGQKPGQECMINGRRGILNSRLECIAVAEDNELDWSTCATPCCASAMCQRSVSPTPTESVPTLMRDIAPNSGRENKKCERLWFTSDAHAQPTCRDRLS